MMSISFMIVVDIFLVSESMFRVKYGFNYYPLVWVLLTWNISIAEDMCPSVSDGHVSWPSINRSSCTRSNPYCLNENMEDIRRCCTSNKNWADAPTCTVYQNIITNPCPDNFNWNSDICIFVIEGSTYPPQCPYEENLPFYDYVIVLNSEVFPIWMPVTRINGNYGIDLLRWTEPTTAYKSPFHYCNETLCNNYYYNETIIGKDCLIYHNNSLVEAVACDEKHTAICAYKNLPDKLRSFCTQTFPESSRCMQSGYSSYSKCFCHGQMEEYNVAPRAELHEPYQNLLYSSLDRTCYIGLERVAGSYVWRNSNTSIEYSNWAESAIFHENHKFGAITKDGWIMTQTENETDCVIYEVDIPSTYGNLNLNYTHDQQFVLSLSNPSSWLLEENGSVPMVFCFTDASSNALIAKIVTNSSTVLGDKAEFYFQTHADGPGNYWCEAFLYPELIVKSSNTYLFRYINTYIEEYVVLLKTNYDREINPISESSISEYQIRLSNNISSLERNYFVVRIYKIVEVNEDDREITLNFHVGNPYTSKYLENYSTLRNYLENNLTYFKFVDILHVDYCVGVQSPQSVTWPTTPINSLVHPREGFCIGTNGSIMKRQCSGNYIDGAIWSELEEPCVIEQSTNTTVNLTNIISLNNPKEYIEQVIEISRNYDELLPLDVALISYFFEQIASANSTNLTSVSILTCQVMEVPKKVLKQAQAFYNTTDRILHQLHKIIHLSNYIGELSEGNLFILSYYIRECNLSGFIVQEYGVEKLCNVFNLNETLSGKTVNAGLFLSEDVISNILKDDFYSKVIVTIYRDSSLFVETNQIPKHVDIVFGLTFPSVREDIAGDIFTVYNISDTEKNNVGCVYWRYDLDKKKGYWQETRRRIFNDSVICTYDHPMYLSLIHHEGINITKELENLISAEIGISEKLKETLVLLSEYYLNFKPIDIELLSKLLHIAEEGDIDDLELLADIINVIVDIPREVLEKSQTAYNATGKILFYFERILQNSNVSQVVKKSNVYAVVQCLLDGPFYGLTIHHCDEDCTLDIFTEVTSWHEIWVTEKADTILIISDDMVQQLLHYNKEGYLPKIVATVFFKDTLFLEEDTTPKLKTKIVGVSFPGFDDYQNGKIDIAYKFDANVSLNYTCSVYQSDNENVKIVKGFWNGETHSVLEYGFQLCVFWKATYFAIMYNVDNLTANLESLLKSSDSVEVILNATNAITRNYYNQLQPVDVPIIAQILSKINKVDNIILQVCTAIVNDIMKVPSLVLQNSQKWFNATNGILYAFHGVAGIYSKFNEIQINKNNLALIISTLTDNNTYRVTVENCSQICTATVFYNSTAQSTALNTFHTELRITSTLISDLIEAKTKDYIPRLVLIIYFSDVLFNENDEPKNATQVFGIYFPDYHQTLTGGLNLELNMPHINSSDYYSCVGWKMNGNLASFWEYESRPKYSDNLECNFYNQNYFTIIKQVTSYENITYLLDFIRKANMSSLATLYRTQIVSYYFMNFQPYDVYLIASILGQTHQLNDDGLNMVKTIVNNILRTPKEVLQKSREQFDALRQILRSINNLSSLDYIHQYSELIGQFGLIICRLYLNASNGIILTTYDIKCTQEVDDTAAAYAENVVASLILDKEIVAQALKKNANPRVIVSVFFDGTFFELDIVDNSTFVLGVSIPDIQEQLNSDIQVLFNRGSYRSNINDCGYWENLRRWRTEYGVDSECFKKCNFSEATYFTLYEDNNDLFNLTQKLHDIISSDDSPYDKLSETLDIISLYWNQFKAHHIYLISQILACADEVDLKYLNITANVINSIMNLPPQIIVESQDQYNATDWILHYIDVIAEKFEGEAQITTENFTIISSYNISGILIENYNESFIIKELTDVNLTTIYNNMHIITAFMIIDNFKEKMQTGSDYQVVITVYFNNVLFNEGYKVGQKNIGPIIGTVIPSQNNGLLQFYYTAKTKTEVCAFWNYTLVGDFINRGHWQKQMPAANSSAISFCESTHTTHFAVLEKEKNITNHLENILKSNSSAKEKLENVEIIITDLIDNLEAVDIYLISKILEVAVGEINISKMNITSRIISGLFHVPRSVLRESQIKYHATDKILHTIEEMTRKLSSDQLDPIIRDNFTVAIYDLEETNLTGLLLNDCDDSQCNISMLEGSVNLTEVINNENSHVAIALSDELKDQIKKNSSSPKLVVTIYFSDVLFNEQTEREEEVSMVCGVLLPGFNDVFVGNLYLMFNRAERLDYNASCAFWNFQVNDGEEVVKGSWLSDVNPRHKENFTVCEYDHITNFALLLARSNSSFIVNNKYKILDIVTAVNSILSLIGIIGILLTAALFERWRRNTGNQILVHFSIAIFIKVIMLYISAGVFDEKIHDIVCSVTGAILHYSILSEFCWMLIIAILQFKRFVEVLGGPPKFVLLKACICGWIFPLLPVSLILLIDKQNYSEGHIGLCYPSGLGLYLGIWLPLIIIITINFVIFIFIMYNVFHKKTESRDIVNHEILFQWRLALLLFSMLGLTWLFGFIAQIPGAETLFSFLFCICATLQGFVMFLFFIVFNKSTRFLYSQSIKLWLYSKGYKMK